MTIWLKTCFWTWKSRKGKKPRALTFVKLLKVATGGHFRTQNSWLHNIPDFPSCHFMPQAFLIFWEKRFNSGPIFPVSTDKIYYVSNLKFSISGFWKMMLKIKNFVYTYNNFLEDYRTKTYIFFYSALGNLTTNITIISLVETQCQIGLLFFPFHYFHSFRDGLGVKKSNFFHK